MIICCRLSYPFSRSDQYLASQSAPIRFFAFHRTPENGVEVQSGATLADLDENPIMEEFAGLNERESRLFHEFEGAASRPQK